MGRAILQGLLADDAVAAVHAVGRRAPPALHPKLHAHVVDFGGALALPAAHEVYLALGTTLRQAGSREAFRAIDFEASLEVARAARAAGAARCGLVSAMGADAHARIFYNRVKGELEEAVGRLGYEGLVVARPSLLAGDREALGQPVRAGEAVGLALSRWLRPVLPRDLRPTAAADVAAALLRAVPTARGRTVLTSGEMQQAAGA